MRRPPPSSNQLFNNADSFAQAFDEAWHHHGRQLSSAPMDPLERVEQVLELVNDHPFFIAQPDVARQVADFRLRLLGL